ncbi:molecular chaperone [Sphingomonas sp. AP4-R1]|uniref:fimbrial biogenesis chaperone n=1 Tax=Sphingomonas sp. AP4-R1 TaxID=2735134 RepID=UPI0014938F12|nr:molecular chaperone [Sphingomonas sp. AP4-R1]QJU56995.1 molecular chaperone [Sphingomonas sp. AP4-R1]
MTIFRTAALASGLVLAAIGPARAASLRISPVGIDIPAKQRAASITLVNTDSEPVSLQIRIFKWSQTNGEDKLDETSDMLVSPPAATVPPGASYTVRVARPAVMPVQGEQSYRIFIDELPKPIDPRTVGQGVAMVLRTSMPVFVVDPKAIARLAWTVWRDRNGLHAEVLNTGQRHAKIAALTIAPADGKPIVFGSGLNGYVLAGTTKRFDFKLPRPADKAEPEASALPAIGSTVALSAKNDGTDIKESVVVGER